jgi:predicted ester cyclase
MSAEENKAVVMRVNEAVNRHDLDALDEHPGLHETKTFLTGLFQAVPDMQATIEELVAEGEWVAVRRIARGTQRGEWQGMAPTGRPHTVEVLAMYRVVNGRIVTAYTQGHMLEGAA